VRDLAAWMLTLVEKRVVDRFIAVGPSRVLKFRDFIETGLAALKSNAKPVWVPVPILENVEGSKLLGEPDYPISLPLWVEGFKVKFAGMFAVNGSKAWATGLQLRPLDETIVDVSAYEAGVREPRLLGMTPAEEAKELVRLKALMD
jgi:2'-hydroxyisoflavone reductase